MSQNIYLEAGFADEDATVMALEADVGVALARFINKHYSGNQKAAARRLRIGQNEVSAILSGNISRFSLPKLLRIARRAGLRMFLDTGDTAQTAYATTLAPEIVTSASVIGQAEISPVVTDEALQHRVGNSKRAAASNVRKH
jgi:predicted XRE-type DNA-binding protein